MNDAERDAYFEKAGEDGVRAMLISGSGLWAGAGSELPKNAEAWDWLNKRNAGREAERERRERGRDRWTKAGVILAGLAAVLAALSWIVPLGHG